MIITLRSKRLAQLFAEVWNHIPKRDRDAISRRAPLIVDNHLFLPKNHRPVWGAVIRVRLRRSIAILYLSPHRLPSQSDSFIRYVIAHELAHVRKRHAEQLFRLTANEATVAKFEQEANEQARRWSFPIATPKQTPKRTQKGVAIAKPDTYS